MGLFKTIKKRITNQYVAIAVYEDRCAIRVKRVKNGQTLHEESKEFTLASKDTLSPSVINYINDLQESYEQTYLALFLNTFGQGLVPSCAKSTYEKFHIDYNKVRHICIDKKYSIYASLIDLKWADKVFSNSGLDFVFSPFLILESLIKKSRLLEGTTLYILATENAITIMIKREMEVLYGAFINIAKEEELLNLEADKGAVESSSLASDILGELDIDLGVDDVEEEEDKMPQEENFSTFLNGSTLFGQDLRFVKYLDASLREFYDSELYKSDFVNQIMLFDATGLNPNVIQHIKETLLVDVRVNDIDLLESVVKLCEQEANQNA